MGRPPKPSALKLITGNPGKRALNAQEPEPRHLQDLTPPAHLSDAAKAIWSEYAPRLSRCHLLTELDVETFCDWCKAVELSRIAYQLVLVHGTVKGRPLLNADGSPVLDQHGNSVTAGEHLSQQGLALSMWAKRAMEIGGKFGMNPRDRAGVSVQPQGDLFGGSKASSYF